MSFSDALSRISQIEAQIASVHSAFDAAAAVSAAQSISLAEAPSTGTSTNPDSATFADALAQAQSQADSVGDGAVEAPQASTLSDTSLAAGPPTALLPVGLSSAATATTPLATATPTTQLVATTPATTSQAAPAKSSPSLPASAQSMLTSDQQQFASELAADTGLDPAVITSWLLAEESGDAAQSRQTANNNDWLNIGYTDSATYGASDSVWSDPTTAADATAGWLKGQSTIPGYGTASSGIQAILGTTDQSPAAQIAAIQQSGWASSGYPDLPTLYQEVTG